MKRNKKIIGALIALVVLCAAYAIAMQVQKKSADKAEQSEEASKIYMTDFSDITGISITNGDFTLVFHLDGDTWYYDGDPDFPVRQTSLNSLKESLSKLEASRKLDSPDALDSYGLVDPRIRIEVTRSDNSPATLLVGDLVQAGTDLTGTATTTEYYACISGGTQVYTVDITLADAAAKELNDFLQVEKLPQISGSDVRDVTVTTGDSQLHFIKETIDSSGNIAWFKNATDSEANKLEDNSQLNNVADAISSLYITSCETYKADETALAGYGLTNPSATITWTCRKDGEDITTTLLIGNLTQDGDSYYTKLADSKAVNLVSKAKVDAVLNAEYPQS